MYVIVKHFGVGIFAGVIFWFDILFTQGCWCGCKLHGRDIWREDIVTPNVVTYAVTLRRACEWIQLKNLSAEIIFLFYIFWFYILNEQRCWWKYILHLHKNGRQDTQCLALQRVHVHLQLYIQNNLCINAYAPHVAATSFLSIEQKSMISS